MNYIAVTQRVDYIEKYNEYRDSLDQRWHVFFEACGITPLLIPNNEKIAESLMHHPNLRGILLTGGNTTATRQVVEYKLLAHAIKTKIPLIGVCQGMQAIQSYHDIPLEKVTGHINESLPIILNGKPYITNSYHEYGARTSIPELITWAIANDGVIKAIKHESLPLTGIMWHPERYQTPQQHDIELFNESFFGKSL